MRNKLLRMGFAAVMAAVLAGCSFGPQPAAVEESVSSQMTEEEFVQELEERLCWWRPTPCRRINCSKRRIFAFIPSRILCHL